MTVCCSHTDGGSILIVSNMALRHFFYICYKQKITLFTALSLNSGFTERRRKSGKTHWNWNYTHALPYPFAVVQSNPNGLMHFPHSIVYHIPLDGVRDDKNKINIKLVTFSPNKLWPVVNVSINPLHTHHPISVLYYGEYYELMCS